MKKYLFISCLLMSGCAVSFPDNNSNILTDRRLSDDHYYFIDKIECRGKFNVLYTENRDGNYVMITPRLYEVNCENKIEVNKIYKFKTASMVEHYNKTHPFDQIITPFEPGQHYPWIGSDGEFFIDGVKFNLTAAIRDIYLIINARGLCYEPYPE